MLGEQLFTLVRQALLQAAILPDLVNVVYSLLNKEQYRELEIKEFIIESGRENRKKL